jgi:hypothetical protein
MLNPEQFIPARHRVVSMTTHPTPYELAWSESHCGKTLSDAIEAVRQQLDVTYDLASSLIWAEVTAETPRVPA